MYVRSLPQGAEFDYIVVGAGSSGCAVAGRLSENPGNQVLLIEAGGRDNNINIHIPMMVAKLLKDERVTWPFMTEPQTHMNGQRQLWVGGKVIGGCSSINGNLFVRGDPSEYDHWRDLGCTGWGYADMLPVFRKLEDYPGGDQAVRGSGGPIGCKYIDRFDELADAQMFIEGVRLARKLAQMPAFQPLVVRETRPGADAEDDAAIPTTSSRAPRPPGTCAERARWAWMRRRSSIRNSRSAGSPACG